MWILGIKFSSIKGTSLQPPHLGFNGNTTGSSSLSQHPLGSNCCKIGVPAAGPQGGLIAGICSVWGEVLKSKDIGSQQWAGDIL